MKRGKKVVDVLSGKPGVVVGKKHKGNYRVRFFIKETNEWISMECPRGQLRKSGKFNLQNEIGFKRK